MTLEEDFRRVDTIIINQNKLLYQECCQYSEKNFTIYLPLINEVKTINIHERSDSYLRYICPPYHPYKMIFSDLNGNEILELNKPYRCCCPTIFSCCQKEMIVTKIENNNESNNSNLDDNKKNRKIIGYIQEPRLGGFCKPRLHMYRERQGRPIGTIKGPCFCIGGRLCSNEFHILSPDHHEISTITKGGVINDIEIRRTLLSSPSNQYQLNYLEPLLSSDDKLVILAGLLFSDSLYYPSEFYREDKENTNSKCCKCPPYITCKLCGIYCCGITIPISLSYYKII